MAQIYIRKNNQRLSFCRREHSLCDILHCFMCQFFSFSFLPRTGAGMKILQFNWYAWYTLPKRILMGNHEQLANHMYTKVSQMCLEGSKWKANDENVKLGSNCPLYSTNIHQSLQTGEHTSCACTHFASAVRVYSEHFGCTLAFPSTIVFEIILINSWLFYSRSGPIWLGLAVSSVPRSQHLLWVHCYENG